MPRPSAPARPEAGLIETTIERIVPGGFGLAHGAGRTLFVAAAAPGDVVRVRLTRDRGSIAEARIVEIVAPGPDRIAPPFPAVAACGAADFAHLTYPAQLAAKHAMLADALQRIGDIEPPADLSVTPSPQEWGYRSRAEWNYDPMEPALGYLHAGSRAVCDLPEDPLVVSELGACFLELRSRMNAGTLPEKPVAFRAAAGDAISLAPNLDGGEPREITIEAAGERLRLDARCFFQANLPVTDVVVVEALRLAEPPTSGESLALDLYAGVGLFTLPLARRFRRVIGVEADPLAAAYAAGNALGADLPGVRMAAQPVEEWLDAAYRSYGRPPFLLLDPPRAGLSRSALRGVLRLRPSRIAYVSCDPATLARDLKAVLAEGYTLEGLAAFDMFPQTHHVESVAHLRRITET
ncbi:MAG: class I SAM-dependent RNA methyltransferase [Thermomicrobiales bacterium]|nr:class I SAM-dependent RNA methyltransferase [Thermomicrobiales bacterium]